MTAHSILGASSAHRWLVCSAAPGAEATMPASTSEYAEEGTAAHTLASVCLLSGTDAIGALDTTITNEHGSKFEVTEEMVEAVQIYLDAVRAELKRDKGSILLVEHKFDLGFIAPDMFGTCDAVVIQPFGDMRVFDLKYGAGRAVDVTDNPQLKYYGLGALQHPRAVGIEAVTLTIVQPRAHHKGGVIRDDSMVPAYLVEWGNTVLKAAAKKAKESPEFVPGEHCGWCRYAPVCAALKGKVEVATLAAFQPITQELALPPVESLTPAQLKKALSFADMVEDWLKAVQGYAKGGLESGQFKPEDIGHKIVAGRASRKWTDEKLVVDTIASDDLLYEKKLRSPAQMEKIFKTSKRDPKVLAPLITETRSQSMVPLDDPREAIPVLAFTPVP